MTTATAAAPKPKYNKPRVADQKMLVGGKWVESASGKTFDTVNPATGEEVGSMFVTDPNPTEYQLYMMAKARREAEEAERIAAEAREKAAARQKQQASEPATTGVVDPSRD